MPNFGGLFSFTSKPNLHSPNGPGRSFEMVLRQPGGFHDAPDGIQRAGDCKRIVDYGRLSAATEFACFPKER